MTDTPTDVVPLAVVPRELLRRHRDLAARVILLLAGQEVIDRRRLPEVQQLLDDTIAALAAAGGREGQDHG